jgi:hypothetical protein
VGLWLQGVPEEDQDIDSSFRDRGADLLVAAEWTAEEPVN